MAITVRKIFRLFLFTVITAGCARLEDPAKEYTYQIPDGSNEFQVSSLAAEGMREEGITELTNRIIREDYKRVDGLLILRNNKLVYEQYFHGYRVDILHNMFSAAKSITSILAGIALDRELLDSLETPVVQLLPEYTSFQQPDVWKEQITVEDLLNMTSGLACDDWYEDTESKMQQSPDWVKFTLDLPVKYEPGTQASYCTGCAVVLGRILENRSGLSLEAFANEYLFGPLDITQYKWHTMPDGKPSGGGLFFLRPRDMAKVGLLMLNEGVWNGEVVVSEEWVQQSMENHVQLPGSLAGYGNLWWKQTLVEDTETCFASGNGGQHIFIVPSKALVVVFTGGNQNTSLGLQNFNMLNEYIIPSIL